MTRLVLWSLCCSALSQNLRIGSEEHIKALSFWNNVKNNVTTSQREAHSRTRQTQAVIGVDSLITSFQASRDRLIARLKVDYGADNYPNMFVDVHPNKTDTQSTIGRNAFYKGTSNAATAWNRTKRKMMIRILQYMVHGNVKDYVWATA